MKKIHIGMRKIKSLFAIGVSFVLWQLIRIILPALVHPIFAYIYSVIEMRETPDKTKDSGKLRIKATSIGVITGLIFITISSFITPYITNKWLLIGIELLFVLLAVLCTLCVAEVLNCKTFCGIAAIIAVICLVSHSGEDRYFYAITRIIQTLIGIISATLINLLINKKQKEDK